jgi:hypothetical protein
LAFSSCGAAWPAAGIKFKDSKRKVSGDLPELVETVLTLGYTPKIKRKTA